MHYHIILTELCNSQCRYCYEKSMKEFENGLEEKWEYDNPPVNSEVSTEVLKKFLKRDDTLIFYGGEPLLQLEKIKEIMDNISCRFCIQTNGKLLRKIPEEYLLRLDKILVSIDGDRERTDFNKGAGTYDLVTNNIRYIKDLGFRGEIVARMTISGFPDIYEQVKHLLSLNLFDSTHWQLDAGFYKNDHNQEKFKKFAKEYNKSLTKLADFWLEEIKRGRVHKLYPFLGIFESLYHGKKTRLRCGSGYANFTITTNGNLSACPIMNSVKNFYCGGLDSGIIRNMHCVEPCTSCDIIDTCGGRCLYSNRAKLWPPEGEELICETIRHLIEEIKRILPPIKTEIKNKTIKESSFLYEKYFGPEIIP